MLKSALRELEASLLREQEFNASHRRVNADYLVNILRKFLLTTDASERSKLVDVLCQILHIQGEESRTIAERWAVRTGGLVGWLLPPKPPVSAVQNGGSAGGKHNQQQAADIGYDPYGAGINPY